MLTTEDVYTEAERLNIHRLYGWRGYIWSSAHARRMQEAYEKLFAAPPVAEETK
jgi:hypothetical protein